MSHASRSLVAAALVASAIVPVGVAVGADSAQTSRSGTRVSIRVEGIARTLLPTTQLTTRSTPIDRDGHPADTCTGNTAAVALQKATRGHWTAGKYSSSLGYPVIGIKGESHPFTSAYYWALWINGHAASTGICGATLHPGDRVLFFPQCVQNSAAQCPSGLINPPVLALSGPSRARRGKAVTVTVRALDNATGKPSHPAAATLVVAGKVVATDARGQAKLLFPRAGRYLVVAKAPNSVRDETTIRVR